MQAVLGRAPVVAVPEAGRPLFVASLARHLHAPADPDRGADGHRGRPARARPRRVPARRRGRALPGMGDAAVRARVAVARDDGPTPPRALEAPHAATCPRSWSRRCARSCNGSARTSRTSSPSSCAPATASTATSSSTQLVAMGYRREYQVEARGEVAVRGSIVDVYPVTDDHPVRIDLWGDEVDRLTAFAVADQRSTHDVAVAPSSPRVSCCRPTRCGTEPASSCAPSPGAPRPSSASPRARSSTAWSRGCPGSPPTSTSSPTCCPTTRSCCSPSRAACATVRRSCSTTRPHCRAPSA